MSIFAKDDVQHPMKLILNFPMIPDALQQPMGRQHPTGDKVPSFYFMLTVDFPFTDDDPNRLQSLPQLLVPNLGEGRSEVARPFFPASSVHFFRLRTGLCSRFVGA